MVKNMKNVLKIIGLLVAFSSMMPISSASAASQTLGITKVSQAKSEWCWAACSEMVGKWGTSSLLNQWDVVFSIKGSLVNPYPNVQGSISDMAQGCRYVSLGTTFNYSNGALGPGDIKDQIFTYTRPFIAGINYYLNGQKTGGHAVVIKGYNDYTININYYDPGTGIDEWASYSSFIYGNAIGNGKYEASVWSTTPAYFEI